MDSQSNSDINKTQETEFENLDKESEDSSVSFHSLANKLESVECDELEFSSDNKPECDSESLNDNVDNNEDHENIYFIDEVYLKDLELTLTEDKKKFKKDEAKEIKNNANEKFKSSLFEEAATLYTDALKICPLSFPKDRAILYSNRAAARSNIEKEKLKDTIKDLDKAIELDPNYLRAIIRRANFNKQVDNLDESLCDYKRVLELDPGNSEARQAVTVLPQQINEKNEKLKEEMMGKLKDLGNMILKPFGLSTNNFELKQDPNSGGYNINFNQNPT